MINGPRREDHQDAERVPAAVTRVQMGPEARVKYEAYLRGQIDMHQRLALQLNTLLTTSRILGCAEAQQDQAGEPNP